MYLQRSVSQDGVEEMLRKRSTQLLSTNAELLRLYSVNRHSTRALSNSNDICFTILV